jgi:hypothetical protein
VFDDGTYEGDAQTAAAVRGLSGRRKDGIRQANSIARKHFEFFQYHLTEALRSLESQVSSVGTDADPKIVQTLASEFPQESDARRRDIKATMEVTATTIKSNLLKENSHVTKRRRTILECRSLPDLANQNQGAV